MIELRLSGGAYNANPALSLGGEMSSFSVPSRPLPVVNQAIRDAGVTWYLYAYVRADNAHDDVRLYIASETPYTGTSVAVAWGAAKNVERALAASITAAPAGVTFSAPASYAAAAVGDNFSFGDFRSLIIRFTLNVGSSLIPLDKFRIGADWSAANPNQMILGADPMFLGADPMYFND